MTATGAKAAHNLSNWPKILTRTAGRPLVVYGGQAFIDDPKLQEAVPGIYLDPTLQLGLTSLNSYLQTMLK